MKRLVLTVIAVACLACGNRQASPQDGAAPPQAAADRTGPGRVRLTAEQLAQIRVEPLATAAAPDTISATGAVEFNGDRTARILAPVAGQVQNLRVNVGDVVHQGDVLFELSSREVAATIGEHLASHKDLDLAEKTFAMTKDLFDHQAASRIALQQSENDLAKARARVQQTEEAIRVLGVDVAESELGTGPASRVPVRAPIGGTVIERPLTGGQFVSPDNTPLLTLADVSSVWVSADVFERDLRNISIGQRADVTTTAYPATKFEARVNRIGSTVDAQTRTAKIRFFVVNPDGRLKPGMYINATLYLPGQAGALTLPTSATFVENGHSFAYVQLNDRDFARRPIETTANGADRVRVTQGLANGDRVVSDGVLLLRQIEATADGR